MRLVLPLLAAALLAACGSTSRVTLAGCLNEAGFLVTGPGGKVEGTTPRGVGFTLTAYGSPAAAARAAARLPRRTTAVVSTGVVDFHGNPGPHARVTRAELATIRGCLERARD